MLLHDGMEIAVAIEIMPTDGESYVDVYAYVFNQHFQMAAVHDDR